MTPRHFLSSDDLSAGEQARLIERAVQLKAGGSPESPLGGRAVALIFEKPSTRTRASFEAAVFALGGHPMFLRADELQLGRGEPLSDTARVLSRYVAALVVRTFGQERLEALAGPSSIPVVNALSDQEHPCQALADLMTIAERFPKLGDVDLAYIGDGNNVAHSLLISGAKAGLRKITVACPAGFEPDRAVTKRASEIGEETGTEVSVTNDPIEASKGARVLYTDVWASMGQESGQASRLEAFRGFQLDRDRLGDAAPDAIVMHCLPAHRGEEIAAEVIDGPASVIWDQAENRLHTQKALLEFLLTGGAT
jgi:ornithine carbamoyltransferase